MLMSIVIPCHNYGSFLAEALASLDAQSRKPDEIIVCDDGSTDASWDIITSLAQSRGDLVAYRHEVAWGLVRTFNELTTRASGDLVVPLSADDRLSSTYLLRMEEDITARQLDFGYSDYCTFGAENAYHRVPELDPTLLARQNYITGTAAIRRGVFNEVGGYSLAFDRVGHEDYDFWVSVLDSGKRGARVDGCYVEWRRHTSGSRNTTTLWDRIHLRSKLIVRHPRFFLRPRSLWVWIRSNTALERLEQGG